MSSSTGSRATNIRPSTLLAGLVTVLFLVLLPDSSPAQELRAEAAVEKQQVYVGESFVLQIQIKGSETPEKPLLAGLTDFNVRELGGRQNSSQSVTIINGRMNRVSSKGYVFSYRLTPKRAGSLTIPVITVKAEGTELRTEPLTIQARTPSETDDFKLRVSLSSRNAYVGQPVTMTVTWYVGKNVNDFSFNVPILADERFKIASLDPAVDPNRQGDLIRIALGDDQAIAQKGQGDLDERTFTTLRFQKVLIPKQAGHIAFPQATVSCLARNFRRGRGRSLLDDFFGDPFGMIRRETLETIVAPANPVSLQVDDLPSAGRPANFNGLVGRYSMEADATPNEVNVGDPITLTLRIAGPRYLADVELPPLQQQSALARDFRIPQDRAAGTVKGRSKVFTQTIRATHTGVTQIPPIDLSYFNPESGAYETAVTEPIPVNVKGTKIITARDAEGFSSGGVIQTELETLEGGIAHNYEGFDAIENQVQGIEAWFRSPLLTAFIALPPFTYFALLAFVSFKRRQSDPALRKARLAYRELSRTLKKLPGTISDPEQQDAALLAALRQYLADRLSLPVASLTFADVRKHLDERSLDSEVISNLESVFTRCEAGRYAPGGLAEKDLPSAISSLLEAADKLETELA